MLNFNFNKGDVVLENLYLKSNALVSYFFIKLENFNLLIKLIELKRTNSIYQ